MKKRIYLLLLVLFSSTASYGQIQEIADKVLILSLDASVEDMEKLKLDTLWNALKFHRAFEREEAKLNGRVNFGFTGNESDLSSLFRITAGMAIDHGLYPLELDLSSNFQTLIRNGTFEENVSGIDISLDYHPKVGNGLFLETYVYLTRFNNTYLGIDQRYEAGAGIIFNLFSTDKLTATGAANKKELDKIPEYKIEGNNLWKCFDGVCTKIAELRGSSFRLSGGDISYLEKTRYENDKGNKKKYSKWRLALLLGVYYENEQARLERQMLFNGVDSLFVSEFAATNKLRWTVRPSLRYKPNDVFTLKLYPYFKLPLTQWYDEVRFNENIADRRVDMFYDFQASVSARVTSTAAVTVSYRWLKDFAPKREYRLNNNNEPILITGQEVNSYYNIDFSFGF